MLVGGGADAEELRHPLHLGSGIGDLSDQEQGGESLGRGLAVRLLLLGGLPLELLLGNPGLGELLADRLATPFEQV